MNRVARPAPPAGTNLSPDGAAAEPAAASFLQAVLAACGEAVVGLDAEGRITSWNGAAEALLGHRAAEVLGRPACVLCPADRLEEEAEASERAGRGLAFGPVPTLRLDNLAQPVPVVLVRQPVLDAGGRVLGSVLLLRDDRLRVESARRDEHYQSLIDNSDDAIICQTLQGGVTRWNAAAQRIFGWTAEEMIGQPLAAMIPPERQAEEAQILCRVAAGERVEQPESSCLRKDGSTVMVSASLAPLRDENGQITGASMIARDIGVRVQAERVIRHHATTDAVTGLLNRRAFGERLREALQSAAREAGCAALLLIGLDHFKAVNDSMGHRIGDRLLRQTAYRLRRVVREQDAVARLGGDEFTVVLPRVADEVEAMAVAGRLIGELTRAFEVEGHTLQIGGSVGVAIFPDDGQTEALLMQHADEAMHSCKRVGGKRAMRLSLAEQAAARDRAELIADLHQALSLEQFNLVYQPVVDLVSGCVCRVEALVRWTHPARGMVSPGVFIPLAEAAGLLNRIGDWVFREATRQTRDWRLRFGQGVQVSINLSASQLRAGTGYFMSWARHLSELELPGSAVVLEITEGMVVDGSTETAELLSRIRQHGVQLAVDDFGTGYSSLNSLSRLDVQYLKIDQSFVRAMVRSPRDMALCEAITTMAHKLGLRVVAEGIETREQDALIKGMGVEYGQGYLYSRPVSAAELEVLLCHCET